MKTKRIISMLLAIIMLATIFLVGVSAETLTEVPEGYIGIYTKDDLFDVHLNTSANYILMNDIIFDKSDFDENYNDGMGWIPIASFSGTFDGNGYKISNLIITGDASEAGFFASITTEASVKNLFIENIFIDVTGDYVGGICGKITTPKSSSNYVISNCKVSGEIKGEYYVAGICGYISTSITSTIRLIEKSCSATTVTGVNYIGGIIGYHYGISKYNGYIGSSGSSSYISKCINTGAINGNSDVGGIVGYARENSSQGTYGSPGYGRIYVNDCYNNGQISANYACAGIIGETYASSSDSQITITSAYNTGVITTKNATKFGAIIGVGVGSVTTTYYLNSSVTNPTNTMGISLTSDKLKITNMGTNWTFDGCEKYEYPELIDVEPIFMLSGTVTITGATKYDSVLEVTTDAVSPDFADLYVQWIADGTVAGTESTYTITKKDIGKTIYAKVYSDDCVVGYISSDSLSITKAEQINVPAPATLLDRTDTSLSVDVTDSQEYSIDNKNWNTNGVFTSLEANTEYTVYTRIAETDTHFASAIDDSCKVTTLKEIISVEFPIESKNDYQIIYDSVGNFKTEIFDVMISESDGISLVKIPVPADFDAESVEVYFIPEDGTVPVEIEFTVNEGFIYFERMSSGRFAIMDKSQVAYDENEDTENNCNCMCHSENIISKIIFRFLKIFRMILGMDEYKVCDCGASHW